MQTKDRKVSIVTVCYNSEETIEDSIISIERQTYKNLEHIIIDGSSTDRTIEILQKHLSINNSMRLISEKDNGIFDAMNKGFQLAKGEIIGIVNSDDLLKNKHTIKQVVNHFNSTNADVVYTNILMVERNDLNNVKRKWRAQKGNINLGWLPPHTGMFITKDALMKVGLFNLEFGTASDTDFILRVFKDKSLVIEYLDEYTVLMRLGGVSTKSIKSVYKNYKISVKIYKKHMISPAIIVALLKPLRKINQYFFRKDELNEK